MTNERTLANSARSMWTLFEPMHAVAYFAPGVREKFEGAGVRGFWRMYFAGRAAPFGRIGPRPVHAAFQSFTFEMVERALPQVWDVIAPADAWQLRTDASGAAVASCIAAVEPNVLAAADRNLRSAAERLDPTGRPFFAAHLDLVWPNDVYSSIWHACTLLREHRGDGYVHACLVNGLSGLEMMILAERAGAIPSGHAMANRGWSEAMIVDCIEAMITRGLLHRDGRPTESAMRRRSKVECMTDALAAPTWSAFSRDEVDTVVEALRPACAEMVRRGWLDYPNPVGVEPPGN